MGAAISSICKHPPSSFVDGGIGVPELLWPFGRALWAGRIGRAGKITVHSITKTVGYWRRYKEAQQTLAALPQHLLDDFGICRKQFPAIVAYAAIAQVSITAAIDHFTRLPPAPLPHFNVR